MGRLSIAVLLASTCAACARFEPLPLEPERSAQAFLARRLADPRLAEFIESGGGRVPAVWPPSSWDLDTLMWAAFFYSPRLAEARAQWNVARAGIVTAGGRPNPSITFTPEYTTSATGGISPWVLSPQLDVPIETAGKRERRVELAERGAESARLAVASVAWQLRSELRDALVDWIVARRRLEILARQDAQIRGLAQLLDRRVAAGEIARSELTRVEQEVVRARAERSHALADAVDAKARAAAAIGVPAAALDALPITLGLGLGGAAEHSAAIRADVARRQALCRRSDLLAALAEYDASQAALELEIAKQYPDIHLGPSYQYDQGDDRWGLGVSIELPVLNRNQGPIAEAEAARERAAAAFLSLQTEVIAHVEHAVTRAGLVRSEVRDGDELVERQTVGLDDVSAAFRAGVSDRVDLARASVDLDTSRLVAVQARADLAHALGQLEDVMQTPLDRVAEPDCATSTPWETQP